MWCPLYGAVRRGSEKKHLIGITAVEDVALSIRSEWL